MRHDGSDSSVFLDIQSFITWQTQAVARIKVMRIIARMNVGGPAVQIAGLMRGLPESVFDQRLFTGFCDDDEADFLETQAPDVSAFRIPGLGRSVRPADDMQALRALIWEIRVFRPDIIHTHTAKAGVLGRVAGRVSGTNPMLVHTYHGHLLHGYFSPAKTRAVVAVEKFLARYTDRFVAVGAQVRDDLLAASIGKPQQFSVVPPGLVLSAGPSKTEARANLNLPQAVPVIGLIGRLTAIKRPDRFAEVVRIVNAQRPGVHFVVAGAGDQADSLRIATNGLPVTMLGWRDDVEAVLAACDSVLLTSDNEGTPLSLIQAGMAGLPVIASDVGSVRDVVINGKTGWLVKPDADDLSRAIIGWLDDREEGKRRGLAGKTHTDSLFGVERLVAGHMRVYRELVAPGHSL